MVWSSENTAIATVDANGRVTAVSAGTVSINAVSVEDSTIRDSALLTITEVTVNQPPTANDDTISTGAGEGVNIMVLQNDTDVDTPTEQLTITAVSAVAPTGAATVSINGSAISFEPAAGVTGEVTFTYSINDGNPGNDATATVTVNVMENRIAVAEITVTRDRSSIQDNETEPFTAIVAPANATDATVTWSSSNTSVATVNASSGLVTAIAAGSATITATANDGSDVTGSAGITVTLSEIVVESITVSSLRSSIPDDGTEQFSAAVTPGNATDQSVSWSSSNTGVATVNQTTGLVIAVAAGTTNITATANDGSGVEGFKTLTVNPSNRPPTANIIVNQSMGTAPLTVDFSAAGSSDPDIGDTLTYFWNFDDGGTSSDIDPSHTFTTAGNYTVTLTVSDGFLSDTENILIRVAAPVDPNFTFSATILNPPSSDEYTRGQSVSIDFLIIPNGDMPSGATYIMTMTTQRANLGINGNNYREDDSIPMNTGNTEGIYQDLDLTQNPGTVTFRVTESLTGISKTRSLSFDYCSGSLCIEP